MKRYAVGADVGGSHISCALIDMDSGSLVADSFSTREVDNKKDAETILAIWESALAATISHAHGHRLLGVGFAMPGPFDYRTGVALFERVDKYERLHGVNVADALRVALDISPLLPIRFINDASAFAIAEAWIGKTKDYNRSLAVTLGTGFGSAFIGEGIPVLQGNVPDSGCLWHIEYKNGIADDYFSTRWYLAEYKRRTGQTTVGVREIAQMADQNDWHAMECFRQAGVNLAEFLSPWLKKFQPDALVFGGNILGAYHHWGKPFEEALNHNNISIKIHLSELMEHAAIIGSARLLNNSFWQRVEPLTSLM